MLLIWKIHLNIWRDIRISDLIIIYFPIEDHRIAHKRGKESKGFQNS